MASKEQAKQVAETILSQLGGKRFVFMTGAKNIAFGDKQDGELFLRHMKGKNGANVLHVTLMPSDTYTVEFIKIHGSNRVVLETHENVYCDMLQPLFEDVTGLAVNI